MKILVITSTSKSRLSRISSWLIKYGLADHQVAESTIRGSRADFTLLDEMEDRRGPEADPLRPPPRT